MKLKDLSTHHVVSVAPQDSIEQAIAIMDEHGVHHLPVVIGDELLGIVSDRDVRRALVISTLRDAVAAPSLGQGQE